MCDDQKVIGVKICACICGQDGVISKAEEDVIFDHFSKSMGLTKSQINSALDDFFSSQDQIDDYLSLVLEEDLKEIILNIARTSAAADGLDVRENIALQRARILWGSHNVD